MDLFSIKFINKNTGWACGGGGILKTTNSGVNWVILSLSVSKPLERIFPVDSNVIYCVGFFQTIIKSTNGGTNWQVIRDGPWGSGGAFRPCFFINPNTGWISNTENVSYILKTTDGFLTYDSIPLITTGFVYDIYFRDSLTGLYCDDNGAVRKTTNGGLNWFSINIPVGTYSYFFRNFSFINNQTGWLVTDSKKVFKTTDFGSNWDSISNIPNGSYGIHCIFFSSLNTGWAIGEGFSVFKSTNEGYNWFSQNGNGGHSIYFVNDTIGWIVGNLGKIFHTFNGGGILKVTNNIQQITNGFELFQNYPNPFNPTTKIRYEIPMRSPIGSFGNDNGRGSHVSLKIFDALGREVETLVNEVKSAGSYEVTFDGSSLTSGIYFYKLSAKEFSETKRMMLIK
jgi:photosystem II stability/assembly factor-like uncharacterized protein